MESFIKFSATLKVFFYHGLQHVALYVGAGSQDAWMAHDYLQGLRHMETASQLDIQNQTWLLIRRSPGFHKVVGTFVTFVQQIWLDAFSKNEEIDTEAILKADKFGACNPPQSNFRDTKTIPNHLDLRKSRYATTSNLPKQRHTFWCKPKGTACFRLVR